MQTCRILVSDDAVLVPDYVAMFHKALRDVRHLYDESPLERSKNKYTEEYIERNLGTNSKNRFVAHFTDESLDGLLIEGFDSLNGERTTIDWVIAEVKSRGIGTRLIKDCIARAKVENKDMVALSVSKKNIEARRLYEKLGFRSGGSSFNGTMEVMGYLLGRPVF
ncbi:GNAT family N-acetyltransferase [Candidatus Woesearchaeota archaeon]|jgi:GNAT superfamily N-acetyltransferase|nr:GNAT family N-acetyltransferase [Candidatus Woesearchaeota archaeon]